MAPDPAPVDPDAMDAVVVEQIARRGEDAFARRRPLNHIGRHQFSGRDLHFFH